MITFKSDDEHGIALAIQSDDEAMVTWTGQLELFFHFLRAQGFKIPEDWEEAAFEAMEEKKEEWLEEDYYFYKVPIY